MTKEENSFLYLLMTDSVWYNKKNIGCLNKKGSLNAAGGKRMKTDVMIASGDEKQIEAMLSEVDKVAAYKGLSPEGTLKLRLLAEEMMGLIRAVTGKKEGKFWIEDTDGIFELHLKVNTLMDESRREQMLSVATSGENEATRSFLGWIASFFEPAAAVPMFHSAPVGAAPQMYGSLDWSMEDYRAQLQEYREQNKEGSIEAWDQLEKSVLAHVADDVKVSIRGRVVELIILKKLS